MVHCSAVLGHVLGFAQSVRFTRAFIRGRRAPCSPASCAVALLLSVAGCAPQAPPDSPPAGSLGDPGETPPASPVGPMAPRASAAAPGEPEADAAQPPDDLGKPAQGSSGETANAAGPPGGAGVVPSESDPQSVSTQGAPRSPRAVLCEAGAVYSLYHRGGSLLTEVYQARVRLIDTSGSGSSVTLNVVSGQVGHRPLFGAAREITLRVPTDCTLSLEEPKYGTLTYSAKIGLVGR